MEFINLLKDSIVQELMEKEHTLEMVLNYSSSKTKFDDCKKLLKEIGEIKMSLAALVDLMTPENDKIENK